MSSAEQGRTPVQRVLTPDDWAVWRQLRLEALADAPYAFASRLSDWQHAPESRWRDRLEREGSLHAVALHGATPVGMVSGMPGEDPATAWLLSMYVTPAARGQGVGELLLDAVERWAVERGAEQLWLEVVAGNGPARRLYERRGYLVHGEVPRDSPDEPLELYMVKPLVARTPGR